MQRKLSELSKKHKITLKTGTFRIEAPLPPDYGFTVGSEYTTPFDVGTMSSGLQKLYAVGRISNPVGLRMRKMYANPEPTEISFDMEFAAYYSAKEEVAIPMISLMMMSLGHVVAYEDVKGAVEWMGKMAGEGVNFFNGAGEKEVEQGVQATQGVVENEQVKTHTTKVLGLINLITAPDKVTVEFGTFLKIPNAFITSTACTFSNVLDKDGYPMSGKVSVTCTLETAPVADDVGNMFHNMVGVRG